MRECGRLTKQALALSNDLELAGRRARYEQMKGWAKADVKIIDQEGAPSAPMGKRHNEMAPALVHLFRGAQNELIIQNPYVVLTENMVQLFEELAQRGVKIKIVTNSPESTDSAITQAFFLNQWANVMARVPTMEIHVATGDRKFHAKCFTIDGEVSGDLSYNADLLSGLVNGEVGAISRSAEIAGDLAKHIKEDLANPINEFKEWTIKRGADGRAILGADLQPIVINGPDQTISKKIMRMYKPLQGVANWAADHTISVAPLNIRPAWEVLKDRTW